MILDRVKQINIFTIDGKTYVCKPTEFYLDSNFIYIEETKMKTAIPVYQVLKVEFLK